MWIDVGLFYAGTSLGGVIGWVLGVWLVRRAYPRR